MKNHTRVSHAALLLSAFAAHAHAAPTDRPATGAVVDASGKPVSNATASTANTDSAANNVTSSDTLDVQVNAKRLDRARNGLSPETGSSVYRFSQADIDALPAGQDTPLNQVL
jgi:hypothetical protein